MMEEYVKYEIRQASTEDLESVTAVEAACFPAAEAAGREQFLQRLSTYPESFLAACLKEGSQEGRIIGFINGAVTDERTIADEMFEDVSLHNPKGVYQAVVSGVFVNSSKFEVHVGVSQLLGNHVEHSRYSAILLAVVLVQIFFIQ